MSVLKRESSATRGWNQPTTFPPPRVSRPSASGFAALAVAALTAAGGDTSDEHASDLARQSSASAGRSIYGGYVELAASGRSAQRVAPGDWLDVTMLIALTETGPKSIGSTEGMLHTAKTSPYYSAWVDRAPVVFERAKAALLDKDFDTLGAAMEQSTLMMHASMLAADPGILYLAPATIAAMRVVRELRNDGLSVYFTMDAGPHVKALTLNRHVDQVNSALSAVAGVSRVIASAPGADATVDASNEASR